MQQTAVEWLVKDLENHYVKYDLKNTTTFLQAKEIEKKQAFQFWQGGMKCTEQGGKSFEQYYNETFKNKL
jgi:hypothetical protein